MFQKWDNAFQQEANFRFNLDPTKLCSYGTKALDDAMIAIPPNELVVIAAGSGFGKSECALSIASHNALRGKKVALYFLEGGSEEAMQRLKWRSITSIYYDEYRDENINLDFRSWSLNLNQHPLITKIEAQVYDTLKEKLNDTLFFYNKPEGLTCEDFQASLLNFHKLETAFDNPFDKKAGFDLDLIVIDHVHYFRFSDEEKEIRAITKIMLTVRDFLDKYHIPVVLVAHLRKLPRGHGIPDKEDIYGSSSIHKIASTCIIIHPDHENDKSAAGLYPTYLRVAKSRIGIRPSDCIYVDFNIQTRKYETNYDMIKCFGNGSVAKEVMEGKDKPRWARGYDDNA